MNKSSRKSKPLVVKFFACLTPLILIGGCGTSRGPSIQIPSFLDIKSVQFSTGVNYVKTLSPQSDGKEIQEILSMLDNAHVVGYEKLPLPEGGYPATVAFDLNVGHDFSVGLARVNDDTVTRGLPNYLDYFGSDKPIRLYSPELYHWLISGGN